MTAKESKQEWGSDAVKALREHLALTQEKMARQLGTRQQTISEWERGLYKPRGTSRTLLAMVAERTGFYYATGQQQRKPTGKSPKDRPE